MIQLDTLTDPNVAGESEIDAPATEYGTLSYLSAGMDFVAATWAQAFVGETYMNSHTCSQAGRLNI